MSKLKLLAFILIMAVPVFVISCGAPAVAPAGGGGGVASSSTVDYFAPVKIAQIPNVSDMSATFEVVVTNNTANKLIGVTYTVNPKKDFTIGGFAKGGCTSVLEPYSSCIATVKVTATGKPASLGKSKAALEVKSTEGTMSIPLEVEYVEEGSPAFMLMLSPVVTDKPVVVDGTTTYNLNIVSLTPDIDQTLNLTFRKNTVFSVDSDTCALLTKQITPDLPAPTCSTVISLDPTTAGVNSDTLEIVNADDENLAYAVEISANALADPILARVQKVGERFIDTVALHGEFYSSDVGNDTKTFTLKLENFGMNLIEGLEIGTSSAGFDVTNDENTDDKSVAGMLPCDTELDVANKCYYNVVFTEPKDATKYGPVLGSFDLKHDKGVTKKVNFVVDVLPALVTDNSTWKTGNESDSQFVAGTTISALFKITSSAEDQPIVAGKGNGKGYDVTENTDAVDDCGGSLATEVCSVAYDIATDALEIGYYAVPIELIIDKYTITKYVTFEIVEKKNTPVTP